MDRPILDSYWVIEGVLLAGEYAGAAQPGRARQKVGALLDAGIRAFFDLTEVGELWAYEDILRGLAEARGITVVYDRVPIPDMGVPHPDELRALLSRLAENVAAGVPSYVHCWGGIGRTGTVVGCWPGRTCSRGRACGAQPHCRIATRHAGWSAAITGNRCAVRHGPRLVTGRGGRTPDVWILHSSPELRLRNRNEGRLVRRSVRIPRALVRRDTEETLRWWGRHCPHA